MAEWKNENSQLHTISASLRAGVEAAMAELMTQVGYLPPGTVILKEGTRQIKISIIGYNGSDAVRMQFGPQK